MSRYAFVADAVVLIPVELAMVTVARRTPARLFGLTILTPFAYMIGGELYSMASVGAIVLLLLAAAMTGSIEQRN